MCGISGAVGLKDVSDALFESIRNLEYRGYDSCGVALVEKKRLLVKKNIGEVEAVYRKENVLRHISNVGIAHTRWATHGSVTKNNTHPFLSKCGKFAVVHNGIISNYRLLRDQLTREGFRFQSETDSEVIPQLLSKFYAKERSIELALRKTMNVLEGTFALAFITAHLPDQIFCAKRESPLMLGIAGETKFIGSDFNSFIDFTKNAVIIEDGEYAVISKDGYIVKNSITGEEVAKTIMKIEWDSETSKKGGYPHYMLKEIYEQPQTIQNALDISEDDISDLSNMISKARQAYLVGVGTTFYVAQFGKYMLANLAGKFLPTVSSDEFVSLANVDSNDLVLAVSQSGETYDTLSALRYAKSNKCRTGAIVNVMGSTMARLVDKVILQGSGPEISVISTKAAISQMAILVRVGLQLGVKNKSISKQTYKKHMKDLRELPEIIHGILNERSGFIHRIAHRYCQVKHWLYLGRGIYYPIALESALKMKEVAYVHAEGMPGGFLKHGTLAMIDENINSIVFMPPKEDKALYELTLHCVEEVRARSGFVLGIHFDARGKNEGLFSEELILPSVSPIVAPFLQLVIAQLLAYFTGTSLKRNVDKPRALAKSVTVG